MSYQVFARKWRPQQFDDVVGQEHITSTLRRAIEKNRVAHGYIFTGTRGVGKTTTARILARALNCEKGPTPDPCGECESCKSILNGSNFDVIEIDGASNNSVDDIRDLRESIGYTSMGGKYRIFVIDEVHMLTKNAFNALLKTLEEPPPKVIFIFATTEPKKIPDTIHSRCQRYDFRRISAEAIAGQLEKICVAESIPFEKAGLLLVARKGDGSMRDSLSLLDQVYAFCRDGIREKDIRSVLGLVENEIYRDIMYSVCEKNPIVALKAVENILNRGFDLSEFLEGFQEFLRDLLFCKLPGAAAIAGESLSPEASKSMAELGDKFSEGDLLRVVEVIRKAEADLRWSSFPRFCVEAALLKIVHMDASLSVQQLIAAVQSGGSGDSMSVPFPLSAPAESKKK